MLFLFVVLLLVIVFLVIIMLVPLPPIIRLAIFGGVTTPVLGWRRRSRAPVAGRREMTEAIWVSIVIPAISIWIALIVIPIMPNTVFNDDDRGLVDFYRRAGHNHHSSIVIGIIHRSNNAARCKHRAGECRDYFDFHCVHLSRASSASKEKKLEYEDIYCAG